MEKEIKKVETIKRTEVERLQAKEKELEELKKTMETVDGDNQTANPEDMNTETTTTITTSSTGAETLEVEKAEEPESKKEIPTARDIYQCADCEAEIEKGDVKCGKCGKELDWSAE